MKAGLPRLGGRGEGWVALQVVLLAVIVTAGIVGPQWPGLARGLRLCAAAAAAAGGAALFSGGVAGLGRQITPFPKPVDEGAVRRDGAYGMVRHPMYGGVLLMTLGWALAASPASLAPWAAALVFLDAKRRREEAWLAEKHPDYAAYRADVPRSLVPFVW